MFSLNISTSTFPLSLPSTEKHVFRGSWDNSSWKGVQEVSKSNLLHKAGLALRPDQVL